MDTPELNFSGAIEYGPVLIAKIRYRDFSDFLRHRRVIVVIVETKDKAPSGIYCCHYRNPIHPPPDLWPVPTPGV